jgi:hypothetical protein
MKTINVNDETMKRFLKFQIDFSADIQQKLAQDDILNYLLDKELKK